MLELIGQNICNSKSVDSKANERVTYVCMYVCMYVYISSFNKEYQRHLKAVDYLTIISQSHHHMTAG